MAVRNRPARQTHVPRVIGLTHVKAKGAEIGSVGQGVVQIVQLVVVKYIGKVAPNSMLRRSVNMTFFLDVEVYVPERLAAVIPHTTVVAIVDSQNRVAEAVIDRPQGFAYKEGPLTV